MTTPIEHARPPSTALLDQTESVRRQFGPAAGGYAVASVHRDGPDLAAMLAAAQLRGDERLVDIGTGAGHTALTFAPQVASVTAVDLTEAMLEQTASAALDAGITNLETRLGDAEALPLPDAGFDVVTCRLCAHHFQNPGRAIAEMARVMAPGGRLLLVDAISPESPVEDTFLNAIELMRDPSHVRDYRTSEWMAMLGAAGFSAELLDTWQLRLPFDDWTRRIGAAPESVAGLRALFAHAGREVRAHFEVDEDLTFTIRSGLFRAQRGLARH